MQYRIIGKIKSIIAVGLLVVFFTIHSHCGALESMAFHGKTSYTLHPNFQNAVAPTCQDDFYDKHFDKRSILTAFLSSTLFAGCHSGALLCGSHDI